MSQGGLTDEGTPELRQATTCQEATARANTLGEVTLTYLRSGKVDSMTEGEKWRKAVAEALGKKSLYRAGNKEAGVIQIQECTEESSTMVHAFNLSTWEADRRISMSFRLA